MDFGPQGAVVKPAIEVCRLCDRVVTEAQQMHRYLGKGWCHGGAREYIPVHWFCCVVDQTGDGEHGYRADSVMGRSVRDGIRAMQP